MGTELEASKASVDASDGGCRQRDNERIRQRTKMIEAFQGLGAGLSTPASTSSSSIGRPYAEGCADRRFFEGKTYDAIKAGKVNGATPMDTRITV